VKGFISISLYLGMGKRITTSFASRNFSEDRNLITRIAFKGEERKYRAGKRSEDECAVLISESDKRNISQRIRVQRTYAQDLTTRSPPCSMPLKIGETRDDSVYLEMNPNTGKEEH